MQNDVKQVDRDAAADYFGNAYGEHKKAKGIQEGKYDNWQTVQAIAAHRIAAEAPLKAEIAALQARVGQLMEVLGVICKESNSDNEEIYMIPDGEKVALEIVHEIAVNAYYQKEPTQ